MRFDQDNQPRYLLTVQIHIWSFHFSKKKPGLGGMSASATIIEQVFYSKNLKQVLILHKLYFAIFAGCAHSPIAVVHSRKPHLAAQAPGDGFCRRHDAYPRRRPHPSSDLSDRISLNPQLMSPVCPTASFVC
jgi:hypothetical protein